MFPSNIDRMIVEWIFRGLSTVQSVQCVNIMSLSLLETLDIFVAWLSCTDSIPCRGSQTEASLVCFHLYAFKTENIGAVKNVQILQMLGYLNTSNMSK